jgi:hypothetical protein
MDGEPCLHVKRLVIAPAALDSKLVSGAEVDRHRGCGKCFTNHGRSGWLLAGDMEMQVRSLTLS